MRHHDAKFAASELYDTMSQSWKGEFMDFFTEADGGLGGCFRGVFRAGFSENFFWGWWGIGLGKARKKCLAPGQKHNVWPPIRAEPGKDSGRQRQIINETAK